jgi:hypothetical protein
MRSLVSAGVVLVLACGPAVGQTTQKRPLPKAPPAATAPAAMTNGDVAKMVKAGLSEDVIIGSIRSSPKAFDLSPNGLIELKTSGVSDNIILVMQGREPIVKSAAIVPAKEEPPVKSPAKPNPNDPAGPHDDGIYAMADGKLAQLEPTIVTGGGIGAGSMISSGLTMGLKKAKIKADIRGARAALRVTSGCEFYFYGSSFNPNTFVIGKLEPADVKRQIIIGEGGLLGARSGVRDKDQVAFKAEKLASGVYKVVAAQPLKPGEYAFIQLPDATTAKLWDFGVER